MGIRIKDLTCNLRFNQPVGVLYYLKPEINNTKEESSEFRSINIRPFSKAVQMNPYSVSCLFDSKEAKDLKINFGIDQSGIMKSTLMTEMKMTEEKEIYNKFLILGQESEIKGRSNFHLLMNKWFGFNPKFRIKKDSDIASLVSDISRKILEKTRVRAGDFLIANYFLCTKFSDLSDFVHSNKSPDSTGIVQYGTIRGIRIFINPNLTYDDLRLVIGSSTKDQELGVYFVEYEEEKIEKIDLPGFEQKSKMRLYKRMAVAETEGAADKFYTLDLTFKRHNIFTHLFHKIKGATVSLLNKK